MKRIDWIDSLKGFGIFCVTFGHLSCNTLIETHIYSFHMFLFFFLSGFLHNNYHGCFKRYIAKITKALFVPFLLWNLLSCLVSFVLTKNIYETLKLFFLVEGEICWNAPIWFLLQLFMVKLVFFFIEKYVPYGKLFCIPALFALWLFVSGNNVFLKLNILPVCLLFYTFGNIFKKLYDKHKETFINKNKVFIFAILLSFCLSIFFGTFLNKHITFTGADFGNIVYCGLAAVSGVLFYVILFYKIRVLKTNKVLAYLGKNSLIIMATQYWFFALYDALSERLFNLSVWHYRNTAKALVVSVVTISLICLIVEMLQKIAAKLPRFKQMCRCFGVNMF